MLTTNPKVMRLYIHTRFDVPAIFFIIHLVYRDAIVHHRLCSADAYELLYSVMYCVPPRFEKMVNTLSTDVERATQADKERIEMRDRQ